MQREEGEERGHTDDTDLEVVRGSTEEDFLLWGGGLLRWHLATLA